MGDIKDRRSELLRGLGEKKNLEFKNSHVGKVVEVLVEEERDEITGQLKGYTGNYMRVLIRKDEGFSDETGMSQRDTKGHENPECHSICHPEFISGSTTMPGQLIPKQVRDDRGAVFSGEKVDSSLINRITRVQITGIMNGSLSAVGWAPPTKKASGELPR